MHDFDILAASRKVSMLDLSFSMDNLDVEVLWFRVLSMRQNGFLIPWHFHSSFEFHFIKHGTCFVKIKDNHFTVKEGEFYLTAPGVYHEQTLTSDFFEEYSLNCDMSLNDDNHSELKCVYDILCAEIGIPKKDTLGIMNMFEQALKEVCDERIGYFTRVKNLILMIITEAASIIAGKNAKAEFIAPIKPSKTNKTYNRALSYISENSNRNITVAEVAKYCFVSERQLGRIVMYKTGQTTKKLIMEYKHKMAKQLLANTALSLKEAGFILGYKDPSNFTKAFKEKEGCTPNEYRKRYVL